MLETIPNLVWGEGPVPCEEMVIGEAPGAEEADEGRPFVGKAGRILNVALQSANIERSDVYITNAYKLRPQGNRNPTDEELNDHLRYLVKEFLEVDPSKILLLGKVSAGYVGGLLRLSMERGEWYEAPSGRSYYYAYHPAAAIYNPNLTQEFNDQICEFFWS